MPCRYWLAASLLPGYAGAAHGAEPALSPSALMAHVGVLTDVRLAGRAAGSPGEEAAAYYVSQQLARDGLLPKRQTVPIAGGSSVNVYAFIAGQHSEEVIVVGAHLDHLGRRGQTLYPGASDNSSGVAALLGLAGSLAARGGRLDRSVLVVFFGAEEIGLLVKWPVPVAVRSLP
jgi:Zn-dependent M28 family amino/carboxypeptidase